VNPEARLRTERVTWRAVGVAAGVTVFGAILLYVTSIEELWRIHPRIQHLVEKIADLIFATGLLAVLWEFIGKRILLDEILAKTGIAREIRAAGLKQVFPNFQGPIDWRTLFQGARHLDILISYGRTWRNQHLEDLRTFATRAGTRIRLIVPDPSNDANVQALAQRYDIERAEVKRRIEETIGSFRELTTHGNVEIWVMATPPVYSVYRFDEIAIFSIYNHQVDRSAVPALILERGGTLYEFAITDLNKLFTNSARCRRIFPEP
jgi:hypothetical protein